MNIKGDDFVKNLEIEKEKEKLRKQTNNLDKLKKQTITSNTFDDSNNTIISNDFHNANELDDIVLLNDSNSKEKYIVLTFAFVLLFLITLIIIRLLFQPEQTNKFSDDNFISQDARLDNIHSNKIDNISDDIALNNQNNLNDNNTNISQNYDLKEQKGDLFSINQNEISNSIKNNEILIEKEKVEPLVEKEKVEPLVEKRSMTQVVQKEEQTIQAPIKEIILEDKIIENRHLTPPTKDFKIEKRVKKVFPKKIEEVNKILKPKPSKIAYYVQVGAFKTSPSPLLINKLKNSSMSYIIRKMTVKSQTYEKVLVGPFDSYALAQKDLLKIRNASNNKKAFILKIK